MAVQRRVENRFHVTAEVEMSKFLNIVAVLKDLKLRVILTSVRADLDGLLLAELQERLIGLSDIEISQRRLPIVTACSSEIAGSVSQSRTQQMQTASRTVCFMTYSSSLQMEARFSS
jgi:hypothetical protein